MRHDFNTDSNGARVSTPVKTCSIKSPPDNVCTDQGGIMDYNQATTGDFFWENLLSAYRHLVDFQKNIPVDLGIIWIE